MGESDDVFLGIHGGKAIEVALRHGFDKGGPMGIQPTALDGLHHARAALLDAARPDAVAKQRLLGKWTARERIAHLVDEGTFHEIGAHIAPNRDTIDTANLKAPADAVVTGFAEIGGRPVSVCSFDFTVLGGSNGRIGGRKVDRLAEHALAHGTPLVMLLDGGGHRIQEGLDSRHFAEGFGFFQTAAQLSGWVPTVAVVMGPGFAGPSNFAALCDFVVMVEGTSTMGIAGPALVKAGTGEDVDAELLGGADVQVRRYGIADFAARDDQHALDTVKGYLSYLPSNADLAPPVLASGHAPHGADDALLNVIPGNPRQVYDVRIAIDAMVDDDSRFELKPDYARNLVTAFARMEGRPVGVIANQAKHLGGTLDVKACEKGAHFVSLCDAFGLPLIYLIDVPGFLLGSGAERTGLARRSARLLYELGHATVPRFSVVLRKGYGLGYIAMCGGRSFDADLAVAWPSAEICAMSIEGAVDVAYRKRVDAAEDPVVARAELVGRFREQLGALRAAEHFGLDDVIDPRETRTVLLAALARSRPRRQTRPSVTKRHGISPV